MGLVVEFLIMAYVLEGGEVEVVSGFNGLGDWVVCDVGDSGFSGGEAEGVAALYSYGAWLIVVIGWSLFIGVVVIMEITRGS